ncbi:MAG: Gfo/Idh/MocA family oxidoreductase [Victivallales bacterium]|nr:Gfo/Idh/MocA family oxidoreductase [Victivallales bacterium]
MDKHKVLVVGMGKRGKHHAAAFNANPRFEVVGICDIDQEKLNASAPALGNPRTGNDAAAMLREMKPDVFCFCTMPHIRYEMVKAAVETGVKLIAFEKPVALSMMEAFRLKKLIDSSGIKTVVSHQHRYGAHYRKVNEIARSGDLGRIQMVYASATGWMTHMMSHMVDYMRWFIGNPDAEWVMGQVSGKSKLADNHPSPDYIAGIIHFADGVRGVVECGAGAPDQPEVAKWWGKNRICVQGTEGFAEVLTNGGWRAVTAKGSLKGEGAMNYDLDMPPYIQEIGDWLDSGKVHQCCFDEAFKGCEIVMGIVRSALWGGQISLPLADGPDEIEELKAKMPQAKAIVNSFNKAEYPG